ncbi:MAG: hypothetical protein M3082_14815 [Candidatus Dormibacteraeota bacterium]|nr:hypothetical protein [Candidatus Dormibacteraeota bacterium]
MRWQHRLEAAASGALVYEMLPQLDDASPLECYKDDAISFFVNCFHLKDWLRKDPKTEALVGDLEGFIGAIPALKACADLANYSKHGPLNKRVRVDPFAQTRNHRIAVYTQWEQGPMKLANTSGSIQVRVGMQLRDSAELAGECVNAWQRYLLGKGLLTTIGGTVRVALPAKQT